ncbi:hypothetical protein Asal01_02040 [Fodinibius salicampi]
MNDAEFQIKKVIPEIMNYMLINADLIKTRLSSVLMTYRKGKVYNIVIQVPLKNKLLQNKTGR